MRIALKPCGDGLTDDRANLQAEIDATNSGDSLYLPWPAVKYLISAPLVISKPIKIIGQNSLIQQTTVNTGAFQINSSDVCLQGLNLQGPQTNGLVSKVNEVAISAVGASAVAPLQDLAVLDCQINNWGMYGVYLKYVRGFKVQDCAVSNIYYGGIAGASVSRGRIKENDIDTILGKPNAYGVLISRIENEIDELTKNPRSCDVIVSDNFVNNVTYWEALDTHAGERIQFLNNTVTNCYKGIVVCDCKNKAGVPTYAPMDCLIQGNNLNSGKTDGSALYGIVVVGPAAQGAAGELAEGCRVIGNTVRGYGYQSLNNQAAVYCVSTSGLNLIGNHIIEPGMVGIGLYFNNYGFSAISNTITDPWSLVVNQAVCIKAINNFNRGVVDDNKYLRGTKQNPDPAKPFYCLGYGLYIENQPNNLIGVGKNYSEATTAVMDRGSTVVPPISHTF